MGQVLATGALLTATPLTGDGSDTRKVIVNTLINAAAGALIAWQLTNLTYWQGAAIAAAVTLVKASVGAWIYENIRNNHHYATAVGVSGGAFVMTLIADARLPSTKANLIAGAVITVFNPVVEHFVADVLGLGNKI